MFVFFVYHFMQLYIIYQLLMYVINVTWDVLQPDWMDYAMK